MDYRTMCDPAFIQPLGHLILAPLAFPTFFKHMLIRALVLTLSLVCNTFPPSCPKCFILAIQVSARLSLLRVAFPDHQI